MTASESDYVFNVVLVGESFTFLRPFVASLLAQSDARFRLVANGCPDSQLELMQQFADAHAGRVVEVLDVSSTMVNHGVALDRVRDQRDDGEFFCLIDPDIKANAPFVQELATLVDGACVSVTSGTEVFSDHNVLPLNSKVVPGEFFFDQAGFVFGSPHFSIYRRDILDQTGKRWGIGIGSGGPEVGEEGVARLAEMGHPYAVFDTGKLVNIFLQADGHRVVHRDVPQLVHIGGLAHFLSPGRYRRGDDGELEPDWARWPGNQDRYNVAKFTAQVLRDLSNGREPPPIPTDTAPGLRRKLELVVTEITDLIQRYGNG